MLKANPRKKVLNMTDQQLIESLKTEASKNSVLNDVLLMFSFRQRARSIISLSALADRMVIEKFRHSKPEYARVLQTLAAHRVGVLDVDAKGRVRALKNIRVSIPTLGRAVVGEGKLRGYRSRARFYKAPEAKPVVAPVEATPVPKKETSLALPPISIALVFVNPKTGRTWNLLVPRGTTPDEIADMLDRLQLKEVLQ